MPPLDSFRRLGRVEDHLHQPAAVAQVDEDEAAVVAPAVHPAGQRHVLAGVILAQLATVVCLQPAPLRSILHSSVARGSGGGKGVALFLLTGTPSEARGLTRQEDRSFSRGQIPPRA